MDNLIAKIFVYRVGWLYIVEEMPPPSPPQYTATLPPSPPQYTATSQSTLFISSTIYSHLTTLHLLHNIKQPPPPLPSPQYTATPPPFISYTNIFAIKLFIFYIFFFFGLEDEINTYKFRRNKENNL